LASLPQSNGIRYVLAVIGIAAVTGILAPFHAHLNSTTVAPRFCWLFFRCNSLGSRPALLASIVGVLCFNYFFLPPVGTFSIADPENWAALTAFFITAITVGQLSARAKAR
jgi:two-component system sensor histidine kinase KdpD